MVVSATASLKAPTRNSWRPTVRPSPLRNTPAVLLCIDIRFLSRSREGKHHQPTMSSGEENAGEADKPQATPSRTFLIHSTSSAPKASSRARRSAKLMLSISFRADAGRSNPVRFNSRSFKGCKQAVPLLTAKTREEGGL